MKDFSDRSVSELLAIHVDVMEELRDRDVLRSANNPTGDLAEYLFCSAFRWTQAGNSTKAFDATDRNGLRYQIKGRRLNRHSRSRQMSAIRSLEGFDVLAAVLFDDRFRVQRGALIPAVVVRDRSTWTQHTNSHKFFFRDSIWTESGVVDVTDELRNVEDRR